ncbi:MAG: hypothetical protein HY701_10100, partial [Gemmatimonadetes bacterium]|nr:hypothetical protein [Gemmatimonadota bacterium]
MWRDGDDGRQRWELSRILQDVMGCCEATNPDLLGVVSEPRRDPSWDSTPRNVRRVGAPDWDVVDAMCDRRAVVKGMLGVASVLWVSACSPDVEAGRTRLRLAFCGQLLCVVPYEVARARGHFAAQGFDVELV